MKWQPLPVFLPRIFHGQRSLVGYSPWGQSQTRLIVQTDTHTQISISMHIDIYAYILLKVYIYLYIYRFFLNLLKAIYENPTANVTLNGEKLKVFLLRSGI